MEFHLGCGNQSGNVIQGNKKVKFIVFHPEVLHKYNVSVNNTTLYFIYNKNTVLRGRHVSTFIRSSSGPLGKHIQELSIFQCVMGSQMLTDCVI